MTKAMCMASPRCARWSPFVGRLGRIVGRVYGNDIVQVLPPHTPGPCLPVQDKAHQI